MNTMHFGEKYRQAVLEGFRQRSYTESSMSHDLDLEFSGARTVHVLSLQTEPLQDYDRTGDLAEGSRFGQTKEVGDFEQTFTMTQDKSLSLCGQGEQRRAVQCEESRGHYGRRAG